MKILVINLLRLGDFIMTVPVVNGLKASRRDCQVDVLTFKSTALLKPMVSSIDRWWTLDRSELQAGLGEAGIPLLTSYSVLKEQLEAINAEKYDLIVNLSQTEFSAWIAGYLKAADRLGLTFDVKGGAHFYSQWFRYLNDHTLPGDRDVFHHTDVFIQACGLSRDKATFTMTQTPAGQNEFAALGLSSKRRIVLQTHTSDVKKDWSQANWLELAASLSGPSTDVIALGAPAEKNAIDSLVSQAAGRGISITPAILSLEGALTLLNQCDLLVTGDTSIKHLAAATDIKVLELSLGSSDWRRTGIFKSDALIIHSKVPCAPCVHSVACSQSKHECGESVPHTLVASAAQSLMASDWQSLKKLGAKNIGLLRTRELGLGFWFAHDLNETHVARITAELLKKASWKLAFNRGRQQEFIEFGSTGLSLRSELKNLFENNDSGFVLEHLDFLERQEVEANASTRSQLIELRRHRPAATAEDLADIREFRRKQIELESSFEHSEFKTKLIRTLKLHWTETV